MREAKIALLIDVDNVKIGKDAFEELYAELKERGEVVYCKFYGYNDRKHIYLSDVITKYGYDTAPFMRFKKRISQLDNRILVDAVKLNYTKPEINTYCVVAGDGDLIPLLVELKSSGRNLIDVNTEFQSVNGHMFDEHLVLPSINKSAEVYASKSTKATKVAAPKPLKRQAAPAPARAAAPAPAPAMPVEMEENLGEELDYNLTKLLKNITERYNKLDFTTSTDMAEKLSLIEDIQELIKTENSKGEGVYSSNIDVRQIFSDLQEVVDDLKNAL